jgi:hypothetical protein
MEEKKVTIMNHEKNNEKVLKKLRDIDDIVAHNQ